MKALIVSLKDKMTTSSAYGLVVLGILLGLVVLGHVRDQVVQAKGNAGYAARELARLNTIKKSDVWSERVLESARAKRAWEETKWKGETVGVVAAQIQQELIKLAAQVKLTSPQVKVANELIKVDGETIMRFSLSGAASEKFSMMDLLLGIASEDKRIIVDDVIVNYFSGNRSLIRMSGLAIVEVNKTSESTGEGT